MITDILQNKIPKPTIVLTYNGNDCTKDFSQYLRSLSYTEYEDEQSDELNIVLNNNDGYFSDLWYPEKGDKLTCSINFDGMTFDCGTFTIDENSFSFDLSGDNIEIKAIATSPNKPVRTRKYKNYSGKTLKEIAEDKGKDNGFTVIGSEGEDLLCGTVIQKNETDIAFLRRISKKYGYTFNLKDNYLTFIKAEELENSEPLFSLSKTDFRNIRLSDSLTKVYGKAEVKYFDKTTKTLKTYVAQGKETNSDTLKIYEKCSSLEEAKIKANAAIKNGAREIKGSVDISLPYNKKAFAKIVSEFTKTIEPVNPFTGFVAGANFEITGIGRFEGKYHIKSSTRTIDSSGLNLTGEVVKL